MASDKMITIHFEKGLKFSLSKSIIDASPYGSQFQFGPDTSPIRIVISEPTPIEALIYSPPQRKEARVRRAQACMENGKEIIIPENMNKTLFPEAANKLIQEEVRKSVFQRLGVVQQPVFEQSHIIAEKQNNIEDDPYVLSQTKNARRNRSRRMHLAAKRREVITPLPSEDSFSILADEQEENLVSHRRRGLSHFEAVTGAPRRGDLRHHKQRQATPVHDYQKSAANGVQRKSPNIHVRRETKRAIAAIKEKTMNDGRLKNVLLHRKLNSPMFKKDAFPAWGNDYYRKTLNWPESKYYAHRSGPVKSTYHRRQPDRVWKRKNIKANPEANGSSEVLTDRPKSKEDIPLIHHIPPLINKRGEESSESTSTLSKSTGGWRRKSEVCKEKEKENNKAVDMPLPQEGKGKLSAKALDANDDSYDSEVEYQKWLAENEHIANLMNIDNDDLMDNALVVENVCVVGHVLTVKTRLSDRQDQDEVVHSGKEGEEAHPEEEEEEESCDVIQELKDKDEQIAFLKHQMAELMKTVSIMSNQMTEIRRSVPSSSVEVATTPKAITKEKKDKTPAIATPPMNTIITPQVVAQEQNIITTKGQLEQLVQLSVQSALARKDGEVVGKGRPYPEEYELVQYPKGFVPPKFKLFDGIGNPQQHIAQFRANCCNAGGNDALLLRLFVTSLTGVAFTWYADLPNNSLKTFSQLEELFLKRFASTQVKVTVGDLVLEKRKPFENLSSYIIRWRNLSMQCEPQLNEEHAVDILMKNIDGPIAPYLRGFEIKTFKVLSAKVTALQPVVPDTDGEQKEQKQIDKTKRFKEMQIQPSNKVREGRVSFAGEEKGKKVTITNDAPKPLRPTFYKETIEEARSKKYSFRKDAVPTLFDKMIKNGLQLPEVKRPEEEGQVDNPNYCPYHRHLGHTIEDCWSFKNLVEDKYRRNLITLAKRYLLPEATIHVVHHVIEREPVLSCQEESLDEQTGREVAISNSRKLEQIGRFNLSKLQEPVKMPKEVKMSSLLIKSQKDALLAVSLEVKLSSSVVASSLSSSIYAAKNVKEKSITNHRGKKALRKMMLKDLLTSHHVFFDSNEMKKDFAYILSYFNAFHDDEAVISMISAMEQNAVEDVYDTSLSETDSPKGDFVAPLGFLISSDSEPEIARENVREQQEVESEDETIQEVQLRGGKVLPPRKISEKDKNKQIDTDDPSLGNQIAPQNKVAPPANNVDYNVISHLRKLPSLLSIYDALMLSPELRESLVKVLLNPEEYQVYFAKDVVTDAVHSVQGQGITFTNEDLLLGTEDHNRPLYITAMSNGVKLNRVFVDQGASVNLMPIKTLAKLKIDAPKLSTDKLMLRGFNDKGERALGSITIPLQFGKLKTDVKLYVINAETSYRILLGRPWIHQNGMVPSTLHQCVKYTKNGIECCIPGDVQPFTVQEVGVYEDAAYYQSPEIVQAALGPALQEKSTSSKEKSKSVQNIKPTNVQPSLEPQRQMPQFCGRRGGRGDRGKGRKNYNTRIPPPKLDCGILVNTHFSSSDSSDGEKNTYPPSRVSKSKQLSFHISSSSDDSDSESRDHNSEVPDAASLAGYAAVLGQLSKFRIIGTPTPTSKSPIRHYTEAIHSITPDRVSSVFCVPPRSGSKEKPIIFHSACHDENTDICNENAGISDDEMKTIDTSRYYSPPIAKYALHGLFSSNWTVKQARLYRKLWETSENKFNRGLGYVSCEDKNTVSSNHFMHTVSTIGPLSGNLENHVNEGSDSDDLHNKELLREAEE